MVLHLGNPSRFKPEPKHWARAVRKREEGMSWQELGDYFGVHPSTVRYWVSQRFREQNLAGQRRARKTRKRRDN